MKDWPRTDFHIHATRYRLGESREEMSVAAIARRCEEHALSAVGIVEHLNRSPKHPLKCMDTLAEEFVTVSSELSLFLGAEVDIEDEQGTVTASSETVERLGLHFVLAAVHGLNARLDSIEAYIEYYHRALMATVERVDFVDVIAHPWTARQPLARQGISDECPIGRIPDSYLLEFVEALADRDKAIEINRKAHKDFDDPSYRRFLTVLRDRGVRISLGSDAHRMDAIGTTFAADRFLQEIDFPPEQIWTPGDS